MKNVVNGTIFQSRVRSTADRTIAALETVALGRTVGSKLSITHFYIKQNFVSQSLGMEYVPNMGYTVPKHTVSLR